MKDILNNAAINESLQSITAYDFLIKVVAIILLIVAIFKLVDKIQDVFESYRKFKNELDNKAAELKEHDDEIEKLKEEKETLTQTVNNIATVLDGITKQINNMQDKMDLSEQARLKDRISQSYNYHKEKGEWNSMEKESMEDLIASYENSGGTNSFVHSVVQKEMYKWKITD